MESTELNDALSEMVAARCEEVERLARQWTEHRSEGEKRDLGALEVRIREWALAIGVAILRRLIEGIVAGSPRGAPNCSTCGRRMETEGDRAVMIHTSMGDVPFERGYFTCPVCPGGSSPLDRDLGLDAQHNSPALQRMVSLAGAVGPFEKASDLLGEIGSIPMGHHKVEHLTEEIGERAQTWLEERQGRALAGLEKPAVGKAPKQLYVEADGTTAPMRVEPGQERSPNQRTPGKVEYREVKLGAVFDVRRNEAGEIQAGEKTYTGTFGDAEECVRQVTAEARARGSDEAEEIVMVSDGGGWLWNRLPKAFEGKKKKEILDWCHPSERLGDIAQTVFGPQNSDGKEWAERHRHLLYDGHTQEVIAAMEGLEPPTKEGQEIVRQNLGYFREHEGRMNYGELRARGYFIGSGVIESACKHIVGARLKQAGMKWSREHVPKILALRVLRASGWWHQFWNDQDCGTAA